MDEQRDDFWERAFSGSFDFADLDLWHKPVDTDLSIDYQANDLIALFMHLRGYIFEKLSRIGTPLLEERVHMESPLPLLTKQNNELERYNELLELVTRAEIKEDPDSEVIPPRIIKASELSLIKLLRKMGNRPLFTTAASLW